MKLEYSVHTALDELRMQMLGTQVLFGFQFQGIFQEGFTALSPIAKAADLLGCCLIVITLGLLIAPAAQHRLVEKGVATQRIFAVANRFAELALGTYALAIGLDVFAVAAGYFSRELSMTAAVAVVLVAALLWYGIGLNIRLRHPIRRKSMAKREQPELHEKIDQMLTEARVILPGAQALLGFQFIVTMTTAFGHLPALQQHAHFAALGLVLVAIMLLIAPAAVHRLGFGGEDSERLHDIGSLLVSAALVPLAAGIAVDLYVAFGKVIASSAALAVAVAAFLLLMSLWYALPLYVRRTMEHGH